MSDSKEIKSLLKQARESIRQKEYKEALKHCKAVLKLDKSNYNAWVFIGVSAQEMNELEQAHSAFERAIQLAPDQLLAWQGLCSFYEKYKNSEENQPKLAQVYEKMLSLLENDKSKQLPILAKLLALYNTLGNAKDCISAVKTYSGILEGGRSAEHIQSWKAVINVLEKQKKLEAEEADLLEDAYKCILNYEEESKDESESGSCEEEELFGQYLLHLFRRGEGAKVVEQAKCFMSRYPNSLTPLETVCKMVIAKYIDDEPIPDNQFDIARSLLDKSPSCGIAKAVLAIQYLKKADYGAALKELNEGISSCSDVPEVWLLLATTYSNLYHHMQSEEASAKGLSLLASSASCASSKFVNGKLHLMHAEAQIGNRNFDAAVQSLKQCKEDLGETVDVLTAYFHLYLHRGDFDKAEKVCAKFRSILGNDHPKTLFTEAELLLQGREKDFDAARTKLEDGLSRCESWWAYHLLGVAYWQSGQHPQAHAVFLKAAKFNPYCYKNFIFLGHYYKNDVNDLSMALKCYKRAFELNNNDEESGSAFSDILLEIGEEEANAKFLEKIVQKNPINPPKWASVRFGLNRLSRGDTLTAIYLFQKALRSDLSDSNCWEYLGEAYYQQGSYESAMKAFQRTAELKPLDMYPIYQIANIKQLSGLYQEAIEEYRNILKLKDDYVPALKGLGESLLQQGRSYLTQCLFGLAFDCLEEALRVLTRVVTSRPELSCIWKLLGDVCVLPCLLGPTDFTLSFPSSLLINKENEGHLGPVDVLRYAARFYKQAISLKPGMSGFWHDLGVAFYLLSLKKEHDEKKEAQKAVFAIRKALSLNPTSSKLWTSLGVIARLPGIRDDGVSQHCFIKAVELDKNNVTAWTNLGLLYLVNGNIQLANEAFSVAQSVDPSHLLCWVGQALIAESIAHYDTMDLFRHTTNLGNHAESLLGYAHWVCTTLLDAKQRGTEQYKYNIEKMHAVPAACDALLKYTGLVQSNASAYSMLGMILERQGLHKGALQAYHKALQLLEEKGAERVEQMRINYARLLRYCGDTSGALAEYQKVKDFNSTVFCELALCLHKIGRLQQSYQAYSKAVGTATSPEEKSHIQVAMAFVARKLQGAEAAKRLLFESSQQHPPSIPGLQALCALGILEGDKALTAAAIKALAPHISCSKYRPGIVLLTTCLYLMRGSLKQARNEILKSVHQYPGEGSLWHQLAVHFLQLQPNGAEYASQFAQAAALHQADPVHLSYVLALALLLCGCKKDAFRNAQKSIHLRPDLIQGWCALVPNMEFVSDHKIVAKICKFVRENGGSMERDDKQLNRFVKWLFLAEVKNHLQRKQFALAQSVLQLAKESFPDDDSTPVFSFLHSLCDILSDCNNNVPRDDHVKKTAVVLKQNSNLSFAWMMLFNLFSAMGKMDNAKATLRQWLILPSVANSKSKILPLLLQILLLLKQKSPSDSKEDKEKWVSEMKELLNEALKLNSCSRAVAFCYALFALKINNKGLVRKNFNQVLELRGKMHEPSTWMDQVARRALLHLHSAQTDATPPEYLLEDAMIAEDHEFIQLYEKTYRQPQNNREDDNGQNNRAEVVAEHDYFNGL